ncbi:MAG: DNA alkylation response protein [Hyphomicrobium sp. SCN 65-11]|nr:MAG: DNA alkylation response protein [Hyphomicrobium sp. SCN 65-11]
MSQLFSTHEVTNQPPPFEGRNLFADDAPLRSAIARYAPQAADALHALGTTFGSQEAFERGRLANEHPPRLKTHDRQGRRLDIVEFHPAYHQCMATSFAAGLHCSTWEHLATPGAAPPPGAQAARAAGFYMAAQMESGHCCPVTMTHAAISTLRLAPALAAEWLPRSLSRTYDPSFRPAREKTSVTFGMGMTEKQGGTDVRTNATTAEPIAPGAGGGTHRLIGHKWFMSAPMSDAFLVLAQAPGGLSCFLLPRFLPDGTVNAIHFQRLKDKLGNRSNASSEVEFHGAEAWLIGEEGRGVPAIIEMVTATRLDCAVSSAGLMRLALANAVHHTRYRTVFQRHLIDQPLMAAVLADMALDVEAATALSFRLAAAVDAAPHDERQRAWVRLMTPVTKLWVCKLAPALVYEAMECLGGNGYVEDGLLARIYREVPVNAIWEGSGNVMALDMLRVLQREPDAVAMVIEEIAANSAGSATLHNAVARIKGWLSDPQNIEMRARQISEALAVLAAATLLNAQAPATVSDAFIATRIGGLPRQLYGQGLQSSDVRGIVDRVLPS